MNCIEITLDGNKWCALLGADLMEGVAGFGDTPRQALLDLAIQPELDHWNWDTGAEG